MGEYDLFAEAVWHYYETERAAVWTEREDGYRRPEDVSWYLTPYREFPKHEKQALAFARGRVLDVGCAAGRHSLYLQKRGLAVTAIDISPRLVELARERGVQDARVGSACGRMDFADQEFDTIVLFGNNLGICGTLPAFTEMLKEMHRITGPNGRILATTCPPPAATEQDLNYTRSNLERGREVGQMRMRVKFGSRVGEWLDLLLFSPSDVMRLAYVAGWNVTHVIPLDNKADGYAVVMDKREAEGSATAG